MKSGIFNISILKRNVLILVKGGGSCLSSVPRKTQKYSYLPSIGFQNSYMELLRIPWGTFHQRKKFKKISVNVEILIICENHGIFRITKLVLRSVKNGNVFRG